MEIVANKIQRFIDHSRFLTLQSAEMLRQAIVRVAAQKALEFGGSRELEVSANIFNLFNFSDHWQYNYSGAN